MRPLKLGTRGSPLGLRQTQLVQERLNALGIACEVIVIKTTGDRIQDRRLVEFGGKAAFTKEIQEQLLEGIIDLAIHSMKDVETFLPEGLGIYGMLEREDPRDAFISFEKKPFESLPEGAHVGTCSPRRQAQLLNKRPDLKVTLIRGNIDTRLRKIREGHLAATFLAVAGLKRMGWESEITRLMSLEEMIPCVGQGAIGIECRHDRPDLIELLSQIHHSPTGICVGVERAFLEGVEGDCDTPVGAYACFDEAERICFDAFGASVDGKEILKKRFFWEPSKAYEQARVLGQTFKEWFKERGVL